MPSQPSENRGERLGEFESRSVNLIENSHKHCRGFQQAMKARTCFISFIKLLFPFLTKRKTIYEARTVNSHNSETVKLHYSRHFRASQRYENTLVDQSKRTYYPNYFINKIGLTYHFFSLHWFTPSFCSFRLKCVYQFMYVSKVLAILMVMTKEKFD